ncbi:unnamed protein product, partial [Bubo scandiacus]
DEALQDAGPRWHGAHGGEERLRALFGGVSGLHLADVVISHDSAAPVGRTSCSKSRASMEHWEEGGTRAGWRGIQLIWKKQEDAPQLMTECDRQPGRADLRLKHRLKGKRQIILS